jgi:hypothetical protein
LRSSASVFGCQPAERFGVRAGFETIRDELLSRGYRAYQKKHGLNFNLGSRRQVFWVRPLESHILVGYLDWNFPALFGIDPAQAALDLGPNWLELPPDAALAQIRQWLDIVDRYREPPALEL